MNAQEFYRARNQHLTIDTLPSATGVDLDAAYAIAAGIAQMHTAAGHRIAGRKVGFANRAMWRVLKLETLVWGHMYDDTVHFDSAEFPLAGTHTPKIEPEIVIKVGNPQAGEGLAMAEWIALGFEIVDTPFGEAKFTPIDFVAAWGLHEGLIVGPPLAVTDANREELSAQLAEFKVALSKNGTLVEEGAGKNSLKSPALCLTELAQAAAKRGDPLQPGELISTGSLTTAQPVAPGEAWSADLTGLPLPSLHVRFR
ncbi:MAG: hypothetical protein RL328_2357 [Acidobacteriota bacterium]|jgi:2-oxo-3-hexenedioate decarboxylase